MAKIPQNIILKNSWLEEYLSAKGLNLINRGKVRDTYSSGDKNLLVVASNRISIFDFVLNAEVPYKGEVLTAMTHFWLTQVIMDLPNHLVLDANNFNAASKLTDLFPELPVEHCLVVKDFSGQLDEFELIFRKHPGGSIWKDYLETGIISGQKMPEGLTKWQCLDWAIFTPSTKEIEGHDINKDASHYFETMGEASQEFIAALTAAYEQAYAYAKTKGILILDTKFEGSSRLGVLADEVLTPDSSRFCEISNWEESIANKKDPEFWDKQIVREWGKKVETPFGTTGINSLDPKNQEHLDFVHSVEVPGEVIKKVSERYLEIFSKLTGMELYDYQAKKMGIIR